jgi:hypothetical protein
MSESGLWRQFTSNESCTNSACLHASRLVRVRVHRPNRKPKCNHFGDPDGREV